MNKTELITAIADKAEVSKKDAEKALKAFQEVVTETLIKGDKVAITGFMTFETTDVPERECRNPQTGGTVLSPAHKKVKAKIGKSLKDSVNA